MQRALNYGIIALVASVGSQQAVAQRTGPEHLILERTAAVLESIEPDWSFSSGSPGLPPLMPEQRGSAHGLWTTFSDSRLPTIQAVIDVFALATEEAASRFFEDRSLSEGWTVEPYDLGDQATLATHRASMQYEIHFRNERFLVVVSSSSREDVERVARYVLQAARDG